MLDHLLSPEGLADPYPDYTWLRDNAPVFLSDTGVCFLTRYADSLAVLGGTDFIVPDEAWLDAAFPGWERHASLRFLYQSVQNRNPPDHTRLRRLLSPAFTPGRLAELRGQVWRLARELVDGLTDGGHGDAPVDLMAAVACPLPPAVIGGLLGVPGSDLDLVSGLAADLFDTMDLFVSDQARGRGDIAATAWAAYWAELVAYRRRHPAGDLASELTQASQAGALTEDELLATLMFLFTAGYATSAATIGNAVAAMLSHPDQADRVRSDPSLAAAAVEEVLRHEAPTQIVPRVAARAVTLGGVPLPAGQFVVVLAGAANRDPSRFPEPDRFDIDRQAARVLSFGWGAHYCLGAGLARMEAVAVLRLLLRRFPALRLAAEPTRHLALRMRMHRELPVLTGPAVGRLC